MDVSRCTRDARIFRRDLAEGESREEDLLAADLKCLRKDQIVLSSVSAETIHTVQVGNISVGVRGAITHVHIG